jgi:hypothetical protein
MSGSLLAIILTLTLSPPSLGGEFSYAEIAKRHADVALASNQVAHSKMQGECLVGLKELNFKKKDEFDAVAEWTSYRSISLLEQFPPCQVLIMMEVARAELKKQESQ